MTDTPSFAAAMHSVVEAIDPIREATLGYRARLMDAGVGAEAADAMAADFHRFTTSLILANTQQKGPAR